MVRQITQRELRNQSGNIMRALDKGEEFVVTRSGVPVGELIPLRGARCVPTSVLIAAVKRSGHIDYKRLRGDLASTLDDEFIPRA